MPPRSLDDEPLPGGNGASPDSEEPTDAGARHDGKIDRVLRRRPLEDRGGHEPSCRCGEGHAGAQRTQRRPGTYLRRPRGRQLWRRRCQGDLAPGSFREHGRSDAEGGREQDFRCGRRWHHDRHGACPGDRHGRHEICRGRDESHGPEARHRPGGAGHGGSAARDFQAVHHQPGDCPGGRHFGQRR